MFVARHKDTKLYRKRTRTLQGWSLVPFSEATVFRTEQGARASITFNVPNNRHLLRHWTIESVSLTKEEK